jgi:L-amino acid N-acyltransferase YncA
VSTDKRRIEEILDELTVNDVLLMVEIAVEWLERTRRIQQRLRRAVSLLGVSASASDKEIVYQIVAEEMRRRMGYATTAEAPEEREVDAESYAKLKSVLERVKRDIGGEEKKETSQVNSRQS